MFRVFILIAVFLIETSADIMAIEFGKKTFNIIPYISYNNFISHNNASIKGTSKKNYMPSISIGLNLNLYEKLSDKISFLHGIDFGYNIYNKKATNIIDSTNSKSTENNDSSASVNIQSTHDEIEAKRYHIINDNQTFLDYLQLKTLNKYIGDDVSEEKLEQSEYIKQNSFGPVIERLDYNKITKEEIAELINETTTEINNEIVPLMDKNYDNYTSWNEAYNKYINKEGDLLYLADEDVNEENATKFAMLSTGLTKKPENYDKDPYNEYDSIKLSNSQSSSVVLKTTYSFTERYYILYKFGLKIKYTQNISFQPFLGLGLNIGELSIHKTYSNNITSTSKKFKAGFSTGAGLDIIVKDRFVFGVNYRLSFNKYSNIAKFYLHSFTFRFGIMF